jgi:hypothetical protein
MKTKAKKPAKRNSTGYGRILDPDKLLEKEIELLFEDKDASGNEYAFYLGKITRSPLVRSKAAGRFFLLPWPDIIRLGVKAGLNKSAREK